MKKKLVLILSVISATCLCFGLSACDIGSCSFFGDNGGTEHEHSLTPTAAVEATCTQNGNIEYWYCEGCGKYFSDSEATTEITQTDTVISATGHTEVTDEAVAPTCTETGLTEGKHCSVCNAVIIAQEVVAAAGHSWGEGVVTKEATCTEAGEKTFTCTVCGATGTETIEKTAHTYDQRVTTETYLESVATCTAKAVYYYSCSCGATGTETFEYGDALGHDLQHHEAQAATCTGIGWNEYDTCSRCDYSTYDEIPATGHDYGEYTYTDGTGHYKVCSNNSEHKTEVEAHTYGDWKYDSASSTYTKTCTVCGYTVTATEGAVAAIGETCYTTLESAVEAANAGDTVTLFADTTYNENYLAITKSITLDLGKHTLTLGQSCGYGIYVVNGATVTVTNGDISSYDTALYVGTANDTAGTVSTLTLDGVTVTKNGSNYALAFIRGYSKFVLNANSKLETTDNYAALSVWEYATADVYGTVKSANNFAIVTNGTAGQNATVKIYEGATVESTNNVAVYIPSGTFTITGGAITGTTGIYMRSGSLTIPESSNVTVTATATQAAERDSSKTGGTYDTGNALIIDSSNYPLGAPNVKLAGGKFTSAVGNAVDSVTSGSVTENVTGFILGGTYSVKPEESYIEDGYLVYASGENTYEVIALENAASEGVVVAIGKTGYTTLEDAIAAATAGDTVTLLADTTLDANLSITTSINLDLNGNTLSSSSTSSTAYVVSVASGASLTLSGGEIQSENGKGIEVKGELTLDNAQVTTKGDAVSYSGGGTTVSIKNSTVTSATGKAVGGSGSSSNRATMTIDNSTLTSKSTGTVLYALMYVDATVTDSTVTCTSSSGAALGAGIYSIVTAKNCTITAVKTAVQGAGNASTTITVEGCTLITTGSDGHTVAAKSGTVNVKDCDITATYAGVHLQGAATVNITDGTTIDAQYGVFSDNNNNVINVSNTTINVKGTDSNGCFGIYHNGSYAPVTVSVTDSEIYAEEGEYMGHGIYISNSASSGSMQTLTVSGCTIQGSTAVEVKHTNVEISNSTLTAIGEQVTQASGNGVCTSGYALALTSNSSTEAATGTVTLSDNTFKNTNSDVGATANLVFNALNGATVTGYGGSVDTYTA